MAHSDRHLFVHLPHSRRAPGAIRAAEVPALHFHRYLGGCIVGVREGGKVVTNQTGRGSLRDAGAGMQISALEQRKTHHGLFFPSRVPLKVSGEPLSLYIHLIYLFFCTSCDGGGCFLRRWVYPDLI